MSLSPRAQMRLLGLLPLVFFLAQFVHYWRIDQLGHLLWMCNIGNLVLAAGLFLEKPLLVRVSALWTIPGLIVWLLYVVLAWGVFLSSTLAHVGGLAVAAIALRTYRMDRNTWGLCVWLVAGDAGCLTACHGAGAERKSRVRRSTGMGTNVHVLLEASG